MTRNIAILLCLLLLLTGCGSRMSPSEGAISEPVQAAGTVLGKIKEINGNEIVLALAEEDRRGGPGEQVGGNAGSQGDAPQTDTPSSRTRERGGDLPDISNGESPSGDGSQDDESGGRRQERGGAGSQGMGDSLSVTLTGKEKLYLIPVTANVTTGQGDNARTIRFTQLAVKNIIRLSLDENDNILLVEVLG